MVTSRLRSDLIRSLLLLPLVCSAAIIDRSVESNGFVGCLFNKSLCRVGYEWCYDDAVFGRCLPLSSDAYDVPEASKKGMLDDAELAQLETVLTQLHSTGHKWSDIVTQCVLQRLVNYFQSGDKGTPDVCLLLYGNDESDSDYKYGSSADQGGGQLAATGRVYLSPDDVASLSGFGDVYLVDTGADKDDDMDDSGRIQGFSAFEKRKFAPMADQPTVSDSEIGADQQLNRRLSEILSSAQETLPLYDDGPMVVDEDDGDEEDDIDLSLSGNLYSNPKFERQERLDVKKPGPWFSVNNYAFDDSAESSAAAADQEVGSIWRRSGNPTLSEDDYFFDVVEDVPTSRDFRKNNMAVPNAEELRHLAVEQLLQRLSIEQEIQQDLEEADIKQVDQLKVADVKPTAAPATQLKTDKAADHQAEQDVRRVDSDVPLPSPKDNQYQVVEADYTFVTIKGKFQSRKQAIDLVKTLADLLQLPADTLTDISVQDNRVTFRVLPNAKGLDSTAVAGRADEMREQIRQQSGLQVDDTGIGDQTRVSSVLLNQEKQQMLLTVGLCVLATAVLLAAIALFLVRRRYQAQQKIKGLTQSIDGEATRDYQDLCRARMATKASAPISEVNKESPKTHPHTITSRDSESSRSSTSSWCEEPVVTNMDISTGHMVLSYMEDHLRNKDRLDQEWQALCAYEAEPSTSTLIASKPENMGKNRYPDILPYDHSRVVLGSLANVTGSDYINASSIADHDPRHPSYIAAQAPVKDSAADFWQLVWEQGSVVLVLLTKLSENGEEMCYRYWPEEGSQLYHIYEVHLVSEHIWCDDYLVRSFYLKNIRTGETRTVTQFHFLSWPENGVPHSTKALLEFRRKVNKSYRGRSCPIVVHCSDGAGRTGTYCLIDMVLHRMAKGAREIDIAATLEHLRDQRPQAVRTKQQFEFVLTAVAEEVHAILRALPQ